MDQPWINHGSTWISVDQASFSLPPSRLMAHVSCVMTPDSWLMAHVSGVESVQRPDSWLTRHAPRVMLHASCSTRHAPRVHASCSTRHAPRVMRHASTLHASCVMRPRSTRHASCVMLHAFSRSIQPLHSAPRGGISHRLDPPINALLFRSIELYGMGQ